MTIKNYIGLIALLLALFPVIAQVNDRVARVGFLSADAPPTASDWKQNSVYYTALRGLGWRDGENLRIEPRWANTQLDQLPGLAAELVAQRVDVIIASAFRPGQAAAQATRSIPIVLVTCDPHQWLVNSLAKPGAM